MTAPRAVAQVEPYPSVEKMIVQALIAIYGTDSYSISTVLPDTLTKTAIRVQRLSGAPENIQVDKPLVEIDVVTTKNLSGTAGYGIASDLALEIQAALFNLRSLPLPNGVIVISRTIAGPRRITDVNVDTYRFAMTLEISVHA
jgi:hypothetical protein